MTGPTSGFPDWQQYATWRGAPLFDASVNLAANQAITLGRYSTGNYASARIRITTVVNGAEVFLWGANDAFDSQLHLIKRWVARNNTSIHALIPIPTTYIKLEVQSEPALGWQGYITLQPVNVAADKVHYYGYNSVTRIFADNLNAGITRDYYPVVLLPGPASIWADSGAGAIDVIYQIWLYDSAGADLELLQTWRRISVDGLHDKFEIPERPWRLKVWNNTAANQVFSFAITTRGNMT